MLKIFQAHYDGFTHTVKVYHEVSAFLDIFHSIKVPE